MLDVNVDELSRNVQAAEGGLICEECLHGEHEVCAIFVWIDEPDGPSVPCACPDPEHRDAEG